MNAVPDDTPIEQLSSLGRVSGGWLRRVGVRTYGDLKRIGVVPAFLAVRESGQRPTLGFLWALWAAFHDRGWSDIPAAEKERLKAELKRLSE